MTSKWIKPVGAAVLAAGMTFVYAETPSPTAPPANAPQHRMMNRQQREQRRFDRISAYLNLTDAQKTQAKSILNEARENAKQLHAQMKQNREALGNAIKADNKTEIDKLSAEEGSLIGKTMAIRTEAYAKIYQTLTPDQKAKADQLPQHMRAMWHQHMTNRRQG
jgi:Spy/CpxP family protein refolding chaperone